MRGATGFATRGATVYIVSTQYPMYSTYSNSIIASTQFIQHTDYLGRYGEV